MSLLSLLLALAPFAGAAAWEPVPRKVVALYRNKLNMGGSDDVFFTFVHQRAEVVLNYLGLEVDFVDADKPLPDPAALRDVRGVIGWFPEPVSFENPRPVCRWLEAAMGAGKRVVLVGQLGVFEPPGQPWKLSKECSSMLRTLGVEAHGFSPADALGVAIASASPRFMGFERKPDPTEGGEVPVVTLLPGGTPLLTLSLKEGAPAESKPVALTRRGGIALEPFWLYQNQNVEPFPTFWVTDPFAFFEAALGTEGLPRPDVATLSGRRVFFSQIDGDGFYNLTEIDRKKTSAEIFWREILSKETDTPFTASLIAGYFDLALYNDTASIDLARRILNAPNVEPASHGYAHPLVWREGTVALSIPRYTMDSRKEIVESAKMIREKILPGGPPIGVFLWTGDCRPWEKDLALLEESGMLGLNGAGGRYDRLFPSYAHLFPLTRQVGGRRQVYSPMYNEDGYTDSWTGPFYGYRDAIETFERTAAPRRIKPVDVYVHYYSAERYASLEALRKVLAWVRSQPLIPVFAGRYVRMVKGFFDLRVSRAGPRRFRFEGGAPLRTVRFDGEKGWPDLAASRGVIGFKRELGSLYVFLDGSSDRELALAERERPGVRLEEANFEIEGWKPSGGGVSFRRRGWWTGECVLAGLPAGRAFRVRGKGYDATLAVGGDGRLSVRFPDSERGGPPTEVRVEPAG